MNEKSPDEGAKFNVTWLILGVGVGTAIGITTKNLAIGAGVGAGIGVILAFVIPRKK
ncbi:MAG: hypothetical protein V4773_30990 [Verrucomicrobiota bacterium]